MKTFYDIDILSFFQFVNVCVYTYTHQGRISLLNSGNAPLSLQCK